MLSLLSPEIEDVEKIINKETKGVIVIENGLNDKPYYEQVDISGYKYS